MSDNTVCKKVNKHFDQICKPYSYNRYLEVRKEILREVYSSCQNCKYSTLGIGKVYHQDWIDWFQANSKKHKDFTPVPAVKKEIFCPECNGSGVVLKITSKTKLISTLDILLNKVVEMIGFEGAANILEETTQIVEEKSVETNKSTEQTQTSKKKKKTQSCQTEAAQQKSNGTIPSYTAGYDNYYGKYTPPVRTYWVKGKSYRVEKEEKEYLVFDENSRLLQVFENQPTEKEIEEIDRVITDYQLKFSKEQKIKTIQSLMVSLDRIKPLIRDALLELEYSGISDREAFIDMKSLVRSHKSAMTTLRKMHKILVPTKTKK